MLPEVVKDVCTAGLPGLHHLDAVAQFVLRSGGYVEAADDRSCCSAEVA
jgi:hypothetical protein